MQQQIQKQPKRQKWLTGARIIGFIIALLLLLAGGIIWILNSLGSQTALFSAAFVTASVVIGLFQLYPWLFPRKQEPLSVPTPVPTTPAPPLINFHFSPYPPISATPTTPVQPSFQMPTPADIYMRIHAPLPLTDPRTIQQRETIVKELYTKLIQPSTTGMVLTGIAGMGKSTLAALVYKYVEAERVAGKGPFQAESVWLRIEQNTTLADLAGNLFDVFGEPQPDLSRRTPANQALVLVDLLNTADTPRLVVLDQFENFLDRETGRALEHLGVGEMLDALNSQGCRCRVLLTSRLLPKGIREDLQTYLQVYSVKGLTLTEGVTLLQNQGVTGTEAELRTAVERSAGHGLALKLLVLLMGEQRFSLSTLLKNTHLWKDDIATNLLDTIYQKQLSELQRQLLQAFSIYREAVPQEAVQELLTESIQGRILPTLRVLLTQSLLQANGEGCYRLHSIMASYAYEHFVENDKQANQQAVQAAHARAAQFYLRQATHHSPPREQRRHVKDVAPLIEAVWQWCQAKQWQKAYELMDQESLFADLYRWGGNVILLELMNLLMPFLKWHPDPVVAFFLYSSLDAVYAALGQPQQALRYYEQALAVHREGGSSHRFGREGDILKDLAQAHQAQGEKQKALNHYQQAVDSYQWNLQNLTSWRRSLEPQDIPVSDTLPKMKKGLFRRGRAAAPGDQGKWYKDPDYLMRIRSIREEEGNLLDKLGQVYYNLKQPQEALNYFEQALTIHRETENHEDEGNTLNHLGGVYYILLGKSQEALDYYQQALTIHREIENHEDEGVVLLNLGAVYSTLNQPQEALNYFKQALAIYRETGKRVHEGILLGRLADLYHTLGKHQEALDYFKQALAIYREIENHESEGSTLKDLGEVYYTLGKHQEALDYFKQALAIYREIENHESEGLMLNHLGGVYNALNQPQEALDYFKQSLINRREAGDLDNEVTELWNIGALYFGQGRYDVALACFLFVQSISESRLNPTGEEIQGAIERLREAVGEEAFAELQAKVESRVEEVLRKELG